MQKSSAENEGGKDSTWKRNKKNSTSGMCGSVSRTLSQQMAQQAASLKRLNGTGRNINRKGRMEKGIRSVRERLGRGADEIAAEEVER